MKRFCRKFNTLLTKLLPSIGRSWWWGVLFVSCGVPSGQMRVSGTYENIKQGDFLILSTDGGLDRVDTLHVLGGEFEYQCSLTGEATFRIIYPNNSELMLWVSSGADIRIKGDVQNLWRASVTGNKENELYTDFRQQNPATDTTALRKAASRFIHEHPESKVSTYLLSQYFVIPNGVPQDSIERLYQVIYDAQPQSAQVVKLGGVIQQRSVLREGNRMPDFDLLASDSVHHTPRHYKGKNYVLYFWAGWQGSVGYTHRELNRLREELKEPTDDKMKAMDLGVLGYSLDVDTLTLRVNRPDESLHIPTYCDLQGFNSPLVNLLGVRSVPLFIIVGTDGKIKSVMKNIKQVVNYYKGL